MGIDIIKTDALPRLRLAEIEFRLEVVESLLAKQQDEIELLQAERDRKRQRDAWDGK